MPEVDARSRSRCEHRCMVKPRAPRALLVKAARLSAIPGVTLAHACARYGVGRTAMARVKKELGGARPSLEDLLIAALSSNGEHEEGELPSDYAHLASWLDHLEHDGCTADEARARVARLAESGLIEVQANRWRLRAPWPSESE
jgi:glutathione S-transferase